MTDKYIIKKEDSEKLLRLLEASCAPGEFELLYTRRPDAYESYMSESDNVRILGIKDETRIKGACVSIIRPVYYGGKKINAAYICGLKRDPGCKENVGWGTGFLKELSCDNAQLRFCSVLGANKSAYQRFEKLGYPFEFRRLCAYRTYIINPEVRIKADIKNRVFRRAENKDEPEITAFINSEGQKRDLFPVIKSFSDFDGLTSTDFYLLFENGKIAAVCAVWDRTNRKQYIVKSYGRFMKAARVLNPLLTLFGLFRLPEPDTVPHYPTLSFFMSKNNDPGYLKTMLKYIHTELKDNCDAYICGATVNSPLNGILRRLPAVKISSFIYSVRLGKETAATSDLPQAYPECALL